MKQSVSNLPPDISVRIERDFPEKQERDRVMTLMDSLWTQSLNVGAGQLARAILVISNGNIESFLRIMKHFNNDPRDVIMEAEAKLGFPGDYFNSPFENGK